MFNALQKKNDDGRSSTHCTHINALHINLIGFIGGQLLMMVDGGGDGELFYRTLDKVN